MQDVDSFIIVDSPGLYDPKITLCEWLERLASSHSKKKIGLVVVTFPAYIIRPSQEDIHQLVILEEAINELSLGKLCIVFTFCDLAPAFTIETAQERLKICFEKHNHDVSSDRIFLFHGAGQKKTH